MSEPIITELRDVLHRPRFLRKYSLIDADIEELLQLLQQRSAIVQVAGTVRLCRDPDDDVVIETALRGKADVLVSGDHDLLQDANITAFLAAEGIRLLNVHQFLDAIESKSNTTN